MNKKRKRVKPYKLIETFEVENFGSYSLFFNSARNKRHFYFDRFPDKSFKNFKLAIDFLDEHIGNIKKEKALVALKIEAHLKAINVLMVKHKLNMYCDYTFPNYKLFFELRNNAQHYCQRFEIDRYIKVKIK